MSKTCRSCAKLLKWHLQSSMYLMERFKSVDPGSVSLWFDKVLNLWDGYIFNSWSCLNPEIKVKLFLSQPHHLDTFITLHSAWDIHIFPWFSCESETGSNICADLSVSCWKLERLFSGKYFISIVRTLNFVKHFVSLTLIFLFQKYVVHVKNFYNVWGKQVDSLFL